MMRNTDFNPERRKAFRIPTRLRIELTVNDTPCIALTKNISTTGILFEVPLEVPLRKDLSVKILLPSRELPLNAVIHIIRIEELKSSNQFLVGAEITIMADDEKQALAEYISIINVDDLLHNSIRQNASDVHLISDEPPIFRINGTLKKQDLPTLSSHDIQQMIYYMLSEKEIQDIEHYLELDTAYSIDDGAYRFRLNIHFEKGNISMAIRLIPSTIPSFAELNLPPVVEELARKQKGLILVTGPAGSGKSTTMAALIDTINQQRNAMIISIEDPIEFLHTNKKAFIKQREVGDDTTSFAEGLRHILRQDPNIIFIGETRDLESLSMAITAAETGHLVLTTLHTVDAAQTVNRIIDMYPPNQQKQIRSQLADCLEAVICQTLVPRADNTERIVATEILIATPAVRSTIRNGNTEQLISLMQTNAKYGMKTLDASLLELVQKQIITKDMALLLAKEPDKFGMY